MNEQTQTLVAIGASIGAHCHSCLTYHLSRAREQGIPEADLRAACEMAFKVAACAGRGMRDFADAALGAPSGSCCGGPSTSCCNNA